MAIWAKQTFFSGSPLSWVTIFKMHQKINLRYPDLNIKTSFLWMYIVQSVERQVDHRNVKWLTLYLCCLWTEMAEILFPGTFFQDVLTFKISALHHFYFQSYNTFSWWISNFSEIELFPWLSLYNSESKNDGEL